MLQPLQLKDVSIRYANDIAELRDFLVKAGVPVGAADTLRRMVTRLRLDRAFRRDLTSHVWVVLHSFDRLSFSNLLGILAIAAAGPKFATEADSTEVHELLRFLMDARRSFEPASGQQEHGLPVPARNALFSVGPSEAGVQTTFAGRVDAQRARLLAFARPPADDDRRGFLWIVTAACLLLALLFGLWFRSRPASERNTQTAATASSAPPPPSATTEIAPPAGPSTVVTAPASSPQITPQHTRSRLSREYAPASSFVGLPSQGAGTGTVSAVAPANTVASNVASNDVPSPPAANTVTPGTDAPKTSRAAPSGRSSRIESRPARARAADIPRVAGRDPYTTTPREAFVRSTSLGIMAGNVMYSPAPVYPSTASAAHVQGEVKLEAEVGRDGTVSSTRIISGPPLLRDAAAAAVQRWRYRPYLYAGKPIGMNATVIMDFQLPQGPQ